MMKKWLLAVTAGIILMKVGFADGFDILPWKMDWGSSIRDYIGLLQANLPGVGYRIWEIRGEYYVDAEVDQGEQRFSFRTLFQGERTSNRHAEHQLQDVEHKDLQLVWVSIGQEPLGSGKDIKNLDNGNVMNAFLRLYEQFAGLYGQGSSDGSYIETYAGDAKRTYQLPQRGGRIDFDAIANHQRRYFDEMKNLDHYWLVIGDRHASCRLYVSCGDNADGTRRMLWSFLYYFTRDPCAIAHGKEVLP